MKSFCCLMVALFCLGGASYAQNNYYVAATGGSDSNSGTSVGSPWATCSHALSAATIDPTSGAVINFIASSTQHAACGNINRSGASATARLVLKCTAPYTAATHCKMAGHFLVTAANNVDIGAIPQLGFEYTNPSDDVGVDVGWQCGTSSTCGSGNGIHVLGNYLHDIAQSNSGGCPSSGAILAPTGHGHTITGFQAIGNLIDHFGINGGETCSVAHGIYVASANGIIENNIITRAADSAIQYYDQACNAVISNNVLAASRVGLIHYGGNGCTPGLNTVDNNIVVNNSDQAFYTGFSGPSDCSTGRNILFSNNDLFGNGADYNNSQPACETRQNQKSENPTTSFVSYTGTASGDYHLKGGSILNGAGTTQCVGGGQTPCTPSQDFAGTPITTQTIGAFTTGGGGSPVPRVSPAPSAFPSTLVGSCSVPQSITLSNDGTVPFTQNANSTITPNQNDFQFSSPIGTCNNSTVPPSCTTNVKFCPSSVGPRAAVLNTFTTAGTITTTLNAVGTTPEGLVSVTGSTVLFDNFNTGSLDTTKWVIDTGSAPGNIGGVNSGTFSASNVSLSQGMLGLEVTQTGAAPVNSVGAEVRSINTFGFGTYQCTMRASSTATTPGGVGSAVSGQVSSCFTFINNSQTENDYPEIEGRTPNILEWTNFSGVSNSQTSSTLAAFAPDQNQHTYKTVWQPGSITYFVDGAQVSSHNLNIPTTPAFVLFNHWGTNSNSFGGTATVGTNRWMYVSNFAFSPSATLNFGNQNIGTISGTQSLTFQNVGSGPMAVGTITITGDYSIPAGGNSCPVSLNPSASCTVLVNFAPTVTGTRSGQVTFNSNDPLSPQTATLTGVGQQQSQPVGNPAGIVLQQMVIGAH